MIYTLPLSELAALATVPARVRKACGALRYQGICCVNIGVDRPDVSDKHWVYFYEDEFPFHRLSFPGNFTRENVPPGKSSISMEVAFSDARPLDRERVVEESVEALTKAGILKNDERIELVHAGDHSGVRHLRPRALGERRRDPLVARRARDRRRRPFRRVAVPQHGSRDEEREEAARAVARSRSRPSVPRGRSRAARGG